MSIITPIPFTDEEKETIAKVGFRLAQLRERGDDLPEHELDDAIFYVDEGIGTIRSDQKYDPEAYAKESMERLLALYVKLSLNGLDPMSTGEFNVRYQRWVQAAAQERYAGRPDSWPEFPKVVQRTRNRTHSKFTPDAQTASDF